MYTQTSQTVYKQLEHASMATQKCVYAHVCVYIYIDVYIYKHTYTCMHIFRHIN